MIHSDNSGAFERKQVPKTWNDTYVDYPLDTSLVGFIERQVEKTPTSTAVVYADKSLTYEQLNAKANQLAHHLIESGVESETLVGICLERSLEMLIGLLGILKAGAAYVPFDPEYPQNRLDFMAVDSQTAILLSENKLKQRLSALNTKIICLDTDWPEIEKNSISNPDCLIAPDNLAYMIYTSGSTGRPKGTMVSHRAIVNRLLWMQDKYQLIGNDRILQKTPMSFDVSVWEFFWPLMTGARLVMAEAGGHRDPAYLVNTIIDNGITTLHFVPSMLNIFLTAYRVEAITSLRQVFCSGEALPYDLVKRFFTRIDARLHNLYGPTEAAVDVTCWECKKDLNENIIPIGKPIANIQIYILDENLRQVGIGETGELHIGGVGLARGYWNREELTSEKFIHNPFSLVANARLYKTGDLARYRPDGNIEYLGRIDFQVKIRGLRIELGEIESAILKHEAVLMAAVIASEEALGEKRLLAYLVVDTEKELSINELRRFLAEELPEYMVPAAFIFLDKMPLTPNGKIDRNALPKDKLKRPELEQGYIAPKTRMEKVLCGIWEELLNLDRVGINDNFFDLGGNSLLALMSVVQLEEQENIEIPMVNMFQYSSVWTLAASIEEKDSEQGKIDKTIDRIEKQRESAENSIYAQGGVAIIGMSGRFPGAYDVDELWSNLCNDIESVTFFSKDELGPGLDPEITNNPNYVFARGIIPDGDKFDAAFFGINPSEAKTMDPQQRVFLELAWSALENSGYTSESFDGLIGVYAGMGNNYYYSLNVEGHTELVKMVGQFPIMVGNEKDHIATRVANKLNLTGPAVSVHTACSTAMTAIDNAFFSLITRQCDMALAGGISLQTPQYSGQLYEDGGVFAIDGHCRPFDADATGTMFSDSAGIIVMKRLDDAIKDNDTIYAVIRSTALNNDGSDKISYLAPSINGQKQVIAMALARAGVDADSISYVETHGTGTPIGDPIEVEALTQVYRRYTDRKQFCGIGSVKSNLGHPTIAAGVTGVIKVALALKNEKIPATLHYKKPNPKIDFEHSPFYVVSRLTDWPKEGIKRRGAVSSFGFGGTNGHAVLEEAPDTADSGPSRSRQLIVLSAKTEDALEDMTANLANYFEKNQNINIADAAFTLQNGRVSFNHRRFIVCENTADVITGLRTLNPQFSGARLLETKDPEIVFMFPGQGSQYINMGLDLYKSEACFKKIIDQCSEILAPHIGCDLRDILYPKSGDVDKAAETLKNTYYQQPAIFVIEYALAKLWESWGVYPDLMVGHSIGEFVCATLSGVFSLDDALELISARGRLMSQLPRGSMLSVRLAAEDVENKLPQGLSLATSNGPSLSVVAGPDDKIENFQKELEKEDIACTLLHTSHAFHSEMMAPAVEPFTELVAKVERLAPVIPFVSTLTTKWVTRNEITDPSYWGRHLRSPVRFAEAVHRIWEDPDRILLEVGPRAATTTLAKQQIKDFKRQVAVASLSDTSDNCMEQTSMLKALGTLWLSSIKINKEKFWSDEKRKRIALPTYPFARKRYWVDPVVGINKQDVVYKENDDLLPANEITVIGEQVADAEQIEKTTIKQQLIYILEEMSDIKFGDDFDESRTFPEMGMDSLFLTQIAFKLKTDFDLEVSFRELTEEYSSVQMLVQYIQQKKPELEVSYAENTPENTANKDERLSINANILPATCFQRQIFNLVGKDGNNASCSFNESVTVTLKGSTFDVEKMRNSIGSLVERHDALRYCYDVDGLNLLLQENLEIDIPLFDCSAYSGGKIASKIDEILKQDFIKPFNLCAGPLFRALIIKISDEIYKVVLTSHLSICDGWSLDVLVRDLGLIYSSLITGGTPKLEAADKFSDYVIEQEAFRQTDSYKQMEMFWKEKLSAPAPNLNFPIMQKLPPHRTYNGARSDLVIDGSTARALMLMASQTGCSYFTVLLAGFNLLLSGLTGQNRLLVGMPVAGQAASNRKFLVGNCLNYVPLISEMEQQSTLKAYLSELRTTILDAIENAGYSFNDTDIQTSVSVHPARVPFIQACLNMSPKMEGDQLDYSTLEVEYDVNPRYFESFEVFVNAVTTKNDGLVLEFQYNSDLFSETEIRRWQSLLAKIYRGLADNTEKTIVDFLQMHGLDAEKKEPSACADISEVTGGDRSALLQPGNTPFYFGESNSLYGVCHIPKNRLRDTGVIFCYPLAQEYIRSHWAFRLLARSLVAEGIPVLRFDYFGTGDSLCDTKDWNAERWVKDVQAAADTLKKKTGVKHISVVSLRFGSILAALAIDSGMKVSRLVLWDPVFSGTEYLSGIKNIQENFLNSEKNYFPYPADSELDVDADEIAGFVFNKELQKAIVNSSLGKIPLTNCRNIDVVSTNSSREYEDFLSATETDKKNIEFHLTEDKTNWEDYRQFNLAILPSDAIAKITLLLMG